jgi:muramoyltetrapeptide carboxypeptidase
LKSLRLLKPPRLEIGDTIGVVAPSHPVLPFQKKYDLGIRNLKKLGFNVKEGKTVRLQHKCYMAGTDRERANDINAMFADEEVNAIVCALGGSIAIRCLRYLDYDLIKRNPKIFSGMSNITTFHIAFLTKTGLTGLHQSDVVFGFGTDLNSAEAKYETDLFLKITGNAEPLGLFPALTKWEVWQEGKAEGKLFGGSINSAETLLGTPFYPKLNKDIIFFWESIGQPLDELDAKFTHFRESGIFERTKGMLIGKFREEVSDKSCKTGQKIRDRTDEIRELVTDITSGYNFPIIGNMDFGHYTLNLPLPTGIEAAMDTNGMKVWLKESYVK